MFNGKIHYKWPCSIAMLNYQRVWLRIKFWRGNKKANVANTDLSAVLQWATILKASFKVSLHGGTTESTSTKWSTKWRPFGHSMKPTTKLAFWRIRRSQCTQKTPKKPEIDIRSFPTLLFGSFHSRLCTVLMKSWPGGPGGPPGHEDLLQQIRNDHRMPRRQRPNTTHRWPPPGYDDPNFCRWSRCNCPAPRISAESWDFSWWFLREVGLGNNGDQ